MLSPLPGRHRRRLVDFHATLAVLGPEPLHPVRRAWPTRELRMDRRWHGPAPGVDEDQFAAIAARSPLDPVLLPMQ